MKGFTNNKDIDRKILLNLSHEDFMSTYILNKYFYHICDDMFFYNKLFHCYPDTLKYFNKDRYIFYKKYYLHIIYYIKILKESYNYIYTGGNPEKQYRIYLCSYINDYESLFMTASRLGELELVKYALNKGANIHLLNEYGLICASQEGHLEVVKYLNSIHNSN